MGRPAARQAITLWSWAIRFSGLGVDVMRGGRLVAEGPANHPVRTFYRNYFVTNRVTARPSWDPIAVLYVVRGLSDYFTAVTQGRCVARDDGSFEWLHTGGSRNHS